MARVMEFVANLCEWAGNLWLVSSINIVNLSSSQTIKEDGKCGNSGKVNKPDPIRKYLRCKGVSNGGLKDVFAGHAIDLATSINVVPAKGQSQDSNTS